MKITEMRAAHLDRPLGYQMEKPVFSWTAEAETGKKQAAARLRVALDERMETICYDSGRDSALSSLAAEASLSLKPRTRYYWDVEVWAEDGENGKSPVSWFETGKMEEKWQASWITSPYEKEIHPLFQRKFFLEGKIKKARAYVCGLGLFEFYVNGKKAGREYLAPFYTDYYYWAQRIAFDITDLIREGGNAVGIALGNGWYKGRFGYIDRMKELYGDQFLLICELRFEMADGREIVLGTDETWLCQESPVLESSIYDGEIYDARKAIPRWSTHESSLKDSAAALVTEGPEIPVLDRLSPPVCVTETRKPVKLIVTPAGEQVLDFGQEITGWVIYDCREEEGTRVSLFYGEILQQGNFYQENLRTAKQRMVYISDGKAAQVRPHFTYFGFRYVKVEGMKEVHPEDFVACVAHSDLLRTGRIETSDPLVNRLTENTFWGQRGNFLDVPTDCPQRDERMGWTGDAQIFCGTASYHMYTPAFYRKYLRDMLLEQRELNGSVPFVVPDTLNQIRRIRPGRLSRQDGSCAWGDAATVIPWTMYCFYGDKSLLEEQYENMARWTDYIRSQDEKAGGRRLWLTGFHFADWLALDNPDKDSCLGGTDSGYVASAYYYYSASLTAKAAAVLGKGKDAAEYGWLAEEVRAAIREEYFTPAGRIAADTQTAMALALYFDLVPEEHRDRLKRDLKAKLKKDHHHLTTGFVGTPYLCPALTENGMASEAYTLLLNRDYPSWLYEVEMGATTVWERWNSVLPDGSISGTGMNSLNHYAYGAVAEWMYRFMCGLNPSEDGPGFKRALIRPYPDERFSYARAEYRSAAGRYQSGWEQTEEGMIFRLEIPFDAEAEFLLPKKASSARINGTDSGELLREGRTALEAGKYEIEVVWEKEQPDISG